MRVDRNHDQLQITVNLFEGRILRGVLSALIANYRIKPDQMDAQAAQAWYSTRGCVAAKMSADEIREWRDHLHGFKSARVRLLEYLTGQLAPRKASESRLSLKLAEAPELLTALNDHRLFLAAQQDIGQAEMDLRALEEFEKLPTPRRTALFEIHLLAQFIEELLYYISPEAASRISVRQKWICVHWRNSRNYRHLDARRYSKSICWHSSSRNCCITSRRRQPVGWRAEARGARCRGQTSQRRAA